MGRLLCVFAIFLFASLGFGQSINEKLRGELLLMREADQAARNACTKGSAEEQGKCLFEKAGPVDATNTKRLEEIFELHGFPTARLVGREGVEAFMLILQHSPSDELRLKCLKPIEKAFRRGEIRPSEYAAFVDRLRLHQKKPQIYGSNFESKDGKLVMSETTDPRNLDKRRRKIGLPPIAEYVKMLREAYGMEVALPSVSQD